MAPVTLHCSYMDSGQTITFYIFDGGDELDLTAAAASVHGIRFDGVNYGPYTCTINGNAVSFQLQSAMTAVVGSSIAEISITKGSTTIGSCNFGVLVENATFPNGVAYDTDPSVYYDILQYTQSGMAEARAYVQDRVNSEKIAREAADTALSTRIDNLSTGDPADNEIVDARTGYDNTSYTNLGLAIRGQITDLHNELKDLEHGVQNINLLSWKTSLSKTENGVSYYRNAAMKVTVAGTNTGSTNSFFDICTFTPYVTGMYCLSGLIGPLTTSQMFLYIQNKTVYDTGSGAIYFLNAGQTYTIRLVVATGYTVDSGYSSEGIYPYMVYLGSNEDRIKSLFARYTKDNLIYTADGEDSTLTRYGITYTRNENGSVHVTGASTVTGNIYDYGTFIPPFTGTYRLSGCPSGGGGSSYRLTIRGKNQYDDGNGINLELFAGKRYVIRLVVYTRNSVDVTFTPKIIYPDNYETVIQSIIDSGGGAGGNVNSAHSVDISFIANNELGDTELIRVYGNEEDGTTQKNILIDTGIASQHADILAKITAKNVNRIDYLVLSHYHSDHMGNIQNFISDGLITANTTVYLPPDLDSTYDHSPYPDGNRTDWQTYISRNTTIKSALQNLGATIVYPEEDQVVNINGCKLIFFNCNHARYYGVSANYNDWSLCNYLVVGNNKIFFAGDLGPIAQAAVGGNLYKANILKSQHHGWDNGKNNLIPAYINNLDPDCVITEDSEVHETQGYFMGDTTPIQSWCEYNGRPHYRVHLNNNLIDVHVDDFSWSFTSKCSKFIRNGKNWKFTDNSEFVES